jgi:hypothetical protein
MITFMTSGVRALVAKHAVADVEDLDAAISDDSVGPEVRRRLASVRDRRLTEVPGVPVSVAAGVLGLSAQSVRAWLDAGVLDAVPGSQPLQVSTPRLVSVVSLVHRLRRAGRDRDLLRAVVDRLEDARISTLPRVRRSLDQLHRGQVEAFSAENL